MTTLPPFWFSKLKSSCAVCLMKLIEVLVHDCGIGLNSSSGLDFAEFFRQKACLHQNCNISLSYSNWIYGEAVSATTILLALVFPVRLQYFLFLVQETNLAWQVTLYYQRKRTRYQSEETCIAVYYTVHILVSRCIAKSIHTALIRAFLPFLFSHYSRTIATIAFQLSHRKGR